MNRLAVRPLNGLLRVAALAGVETAVRLHANRGDDLDARDADGMTPLMLAASRNKAGVCALLLASGADASLTNPLGRSALDIAKAAGASEAVSVLSPPAPEAEDASVAETELAMAGEDGFDLSGWEVEEDGPAPEGDATLVESAAILHKAISGHVPIDTAEDWEDFEAFLPETAEPLPRVGDEEGRRRIRRLLLRALREGSVPEREVAALCDSDDGTPNPEGEALLGLVLGELGAETDERIETEEPGDGAEESDAEADELSGALAFLDDLGSTRGEPLRIYVKEMSWRRLLTAEEEPALAREIEDGASCALDALARWPEGIAAVLAAADRVASGESDADEVSIGAEPEPSEDSAEELAAEPEDAEAESGNGDVSYSEVRALPEAASEFVGRAAEIARLARHVGKGGAGEKALREALSAANLSRSFLLALANGAKPDAGGPTGSFAAAIARQASARERMAVANLRLALFIAKRYQGRGLPLDDLVQEGNIGLLKAVDRFDWRKGFRFSTYATWWIRQQVMRALADKGKTIRTPVHVHDATLRMLREVDAIERTTGRRPSAAALAETFSKTPRKMAALFACMEEPLPLYEPDGDGLTPADLLIDERAADPCAAAEIKELTEALKGALAQIEPKAAEVITLRFGLDGDEPRTLEEIGQIYGVTRERIRQIEAKSLKKLRHPSRSDMLREYVEGIPFAKAEAKEIEGEGPGGRQTEVTSDADRPEEEVGEMLAERHAVEESVIVKRPVQKTTDSAIAMAREIGVEVEDCRETGGDVLIRLNRTDDAKRRRLARMLIETGFKPWRGAGYRK